MNNASEFILKLVEIFGNIEVLITAIISVAAAAVVGYKQIKKLWDERKLLEAAAPFIGAAETEPLKLYNTLVEKPPLESLYADTNTDKNNIVVQALKEREPKLLKKMKLKDALQIGDWVSSAYQMIKPIIKAFKK